MPSAVFTTSSISGTNTDKKRGGTVTGSFYLSAGSIPPAGSTIRSVTVYFSNIAVYATTTAGFSTAYGSIDLGLDSSGSQTCNMYGVSSALLNFNGGSITFTVTGGSSTSSNILNVRSGSVIQITVNYVATTASTGSLDKTAVVQGGDITMRINPASSDYTHAIMWYRDSGSSDIQSCPAGVTSVTYTIPTTWNTGPATATIISFYGGNEVGRVAYSFTISVDPTTIVPTAGNLYVQRMQSSDLPSSWDVYVKGYSFAYLALDGCSPGDGASYKSIALLYGSQSRTTQSETAYIAGPLLETGELTCRAVVTNNYGNAASTAAQTITVYDYNTPVIVNVTAFRCTSTGVPSDTGHYIGVTATVNIASVAGLNQLVALQAQYAPAGSSTWSTAVALTNGQQAIIGGDVYETSKYQVQITAIDSIQNQKGTYSRTTVTALTSEHVMFFMDGGLNVSVGTEGTRQNAVEINKNWSVWHGDDELTGTTPVTRGGTGADDAPQALVNLGAVAKAGDAMTGNLSIIHGNFPCVYVNNPTVNAYAQMAVDNSAKTAYFLCGDIDNSNRYRGLMILPNPQTGVSDALMFVDDADGGWDTYRIFHAGMTQGIPIANGGTGATTAAEARSNLGTNNASNLTSGTVSAARLPFKVARGATTVTGVSWTSVSFSGFSSAPTVVVSFSGDASSSGINCLKTRNESSSGFQVCMAGSSGSGTRSVNWIAIGS